MTESRFGATATRVLLASAGELGLRSAAKNLPRNRIVTDAIYGLNFAPIWLVELNVRK
jgi:hypothetical protein